MKTPEQIEKETQIIVDEVISGKWGTGHQLQVRLTNAGYDYQKIMNRVDKKRKATYVQNMHKMWQDS